MIANDAASLGSNDNPQARVQCQVLVSAEQVGKESKTLLYHSL